MSYQPIMFPGNVTIYHLCFINYISEPHFVHSVFGSEESCAARLGNFMGN